MPLTYAQLVEAANAKTVEAQAIAGKEDFDPEVDQKAIDDLLKESESYRKRAETMKAVMTVPEPVKPEKPTKGLVVTEDETDKALKHAPPFKSLGHMLQAVATEGDTNKALRALKGKEAWMEGAYNLEGGVGDWVVGSVNPRTDKAIRSKAISGMSELVPADGGILVGTDQNSSIMGRTYEVGNILQRASMLGISANSNGMTFNKEAETSRVDGSRRGGILAYWAAEGDEKTSSKPKFEQLELKLNKIIGLVYATDELLADASALEGWIMDKLPEELVFKVEDSMFRGTGAGQPEGILTTGALVTVPIEAGQAADTIVTENILNMWARRWVRKNDYVWMINQDVGPQLPQLNLGVGTGGQLVYMPPGGLSGAEYGTIRGRPVIETEYSSTLGDVGDIILCSWSEYQMIEKGGVQSASSLHVRFVYDEQVFRFVYRIDGESLWSSDLTPFQGTDTVSPFVTLAERA